MQLGEGLGGKAIDKELGRSGRHRLVGLDFRLS